MIRPDERDIIGARPKRAQDLGPLFAQPAAADNATANAVRGGRLRGGLIGDALAAGVIARFLEERRVDASRFADVAASSDRAEKLLALATRAANAILEATDRFAIWEVRVALGHYNLLANDGEEDLDALGALGRRLGCVAAGSERPPLWAMHLMPKSHGNRHTIWVRASRLREYLERQAAA